MAVYLVLFLAALWAGAQNALAGGGSFVTLAALLYSGIDARAANITSTVALFPGQLASGWLGRELVGGIGILSFRALMVISLAGGAVGALLLLATPSSVFERMLPFLVLFATGVFAWGSFRRRSGADARRLSARAAAAGQFMIAIYGGYFGGGIGFLMLAVLTMAGVAVRRASAAKNALAAVMNASAVAIFVASPAVSWPRAAVVCAGAILGGYGGVWLVKRLNERLLRALVVGIGVVLTVALFVRAYG
ncbi:MAG TPA: sulfite exporter TauE/SafE family protein [Acidisphaera sp.]|nr:sulfite exporter TauE/SafE family protein [Acidisphaera sp.]HME20909.1 sulfite exporter TauE/SafE family protein [Acetobacteraceae bacterium]